MLVSSDGSNGGMVETAKRGIDKRTKSVYEVFIEFVAASGSEAVKSFASDCRKNPTGRIKKLTH